MAEKKSGEYGNGDASLFAMGGEPAVKKLVGHFYDAMESNPDAQRIRSLHPAKLDLSREKLTAFLTGWLGGPARYNERWGIIRIPHFHAHLPISPVERDAWLACMQRAVDQMDIDGAFRSYFMREITRPADRCVNRESDR